MSERLSDEVDDMADLSKGVFERGYNRGLELGREQGIEQGIERGYEQIARLTAYLSEQGRSDELLTALVDPQMLDKLVSGLPSEE